MVRVGGLVEIEVQLRSVFGPVADAVTHLCVKEHLLACDVHTRAKTERPTQ